MDTPLPGLEGYDHDWIRSQLAHRHVRDVRDEAIILYINKAKGDRRLALAAILSVCDGRTHEPLRQHLEMDA